LSAPTPQTNSGNPWDALSDFFDTTKDADEIPAGVADHVGVPDARVSTWSNQVCEQYGLELG